MACIFCRESSETTKIFNGHKLCGDATAQVREHIMQLLGLQTKKRNIFVCNECMNKLHQIIDLKQSRHTNLCTNQDQSVSTCSTPTSEMSEGTEAPPQERRPSRSQSSYSSRPPSSVAELDMIWNTSMPSSPHHTSISRCTRSASRRTLCMFWCNQCDFNFEDLDELTIHLVKIHGCLPLHFCEECNYRYTTQDHLKMHEKKFHDTSPFFCIICKVETKNSDDLQEHLQQHVDYSNVSCNYCDLSFLTRQQRETHVRNDHKGKKRRKRKGYFDLEQFDAIPDLANTNSSVNNREEKLFQMKVLILGKTKENQNVINSEHLNTAATQFREYCNSKNKSTIVDDIIKEKSRQFSERSKSQTTSQVVECTSTTDTTTTGQSSKNAEAGSQSSECSSSTDATITDRRVTSRNVSSEHCSSTNIINTDSEEMDGHSEVETEPEVFSPTLNKEKPKVTLHRTTSVDVTSFEQIMS